MLYLYSYPSLATVFGEKIIFRNFLKIGSHFLCLGLGLFIYKLGLRIISHGFASCLPAFREIARGDQIRCKRKCIAS